MRTHTHTHTQPGRAREAGREGRSCRLSVLDADLYVEGPGCGDHLEQVISHQDVAAAETESRVEVRGRGERGGGRSLGGQSPLLTLLDFVDLLQRDLPQRLLLLEHKGFLIKQEVLGPSRLGSLLFGCFL